jgi:hypothetical protein
MKNMKGGAVQSQTQLQTQLQTQSPLSTLSSEFYESSKLSNPSELLKTPTKLDKKSTENTVYEENEENTVYEGNEGYEGYEEYEEVLFDYIKYLTEVISNNNLIEEIQIFSYNLTCLLLKLKGLLNYRGLSNQQFKNCFKIDLITFELENELILSENDQPSIENLVSKLKEIGLGPTKYIFEDDKNNTIIISPKTINVHKKDSIEIEGCYCSVDSSKLIIFGLFGFS